MSFFFFYIGRWFFVSAVRENSFWNVKDPFIFSWRAWNVNLLAQTTCQMLNIETRAAHAGTRIIGGKITREIALENLEYRLFIRSLIFVGEFNMNIHRTYAHIGQFLALSKIEFKLDFLGNETLNETVLSHFRLIFTRGITVCQLYYIWKFYFLQNEASNGTISF